MRSAVSESQTGESDSYVQTHDGTLQTPVTDVFMTWCGEAAPGRPYDGELIDTAKFHAPRKRTDVCTTK